MSRIDIYKGFEVKKVGDKLALTRFFDVVDIQGNVINKMNNLRCGIKEDYKKIIDKAVTETIELIKQQGLKLI